MNTKLASQMVNFIAASSALNNRLMADVQAYRNREKAAAAKRPAVLDLMLQTGSVAPHMKQAAVDMLNDPAQALDLLANSINKMQQYKTAAEKASSQLGQAVSEKEAGVKSATVGRDSLRDPYIGRRTSEKKASDLAFLRLLDAPGS